MSDDIERSVASDGSVAGEPTPCPHVRGTVTQYCSLNFTLTDEEREAVEAAARIIDAYEYEMDGFSSGAAATLRGLLERLP